MTPCDDIRTSLGAYALGALEPEEASHVAYHLAQCEGCRRELEQLSFASELLRTPQARVLAKEPDEPPEVAAALTAVAAERARERRRLRRAAGAAVGGGAILLIALGIAVSLATRPVDSFAPAGIAAPLRPTAGVDASADVRLTSRPWGTQVDLVAERMPALPAGAYYVLWLLRADGSKVAAGSFKPAKPAGRARVRLAGSLPLGEVVRIGVTREGIGGSAQVLSGLPARGGA